MESRRVFSVAQLVLWRRFGFLGSYERHWMGYVSFRSSTWRLIPFSKGFIAVVIGSPLAGVIPLPNRFFMTYKLGVILATYIHWEPILQVVVDSNDHWSKQSKNLNKNHRLRQ